MEMKKIIKTKAKGKFPPKNPIIKPTSSWITPIHYDFDKDEYLNMSASHSLPMKKALNENNPVDKMSNRVEKLKTESGCENVKDSIVETLIVFNDLKEEKLIGNLQDADKKHEEKISKLEQEYKSELLACEKKMFNDNCENYKQMLNTLLSETYTELADKLYNDISQMNQGSDEITEEIKEMYQETANAAAQQLIITLIDDTKDQMQKSN